MKRILILSAIVFCFAACNNSNSTESSATDSVSVNSNVTPPTTSVPTGTGGNQVDSSRAGTMSQDSENGNVSGSHTNATGTTDSVH